MWYYDSVKISRDTFLLNFRKAHATPRRVLFVYFFNISIGEQWGYVSEFYSTGPQFGGSFLIFLNRCILIDRCTVNDKHGKKQGD